MVFFRPSLSHNGSSDRSCPSVIIVCLLAQKKTPVPWIQAIKSPQTVQIKEKLLCLHVLYFARYTLQTLEILCFELPQPHFSVPIGVTIKCAFVRRWFVPTHVCVLVNYGSRPVHSHREEWSTLPGCSKVMHSCQ